MKRWYVVYTRARGEAWAAGNLVKQGFEVYFPKIRKEVRHARRIRSVLAPLFPRYLLVRLDTERQRWRSVNGTFGVSHIICQGETPAPVPDQVISAIRGREDESGVVRLVPKGLKPGDQVRVREGAFADYSALLKEICGQERVILLLELMGRSVRVTVPLENIAAAG